MQILLDKEVDINAESEEYNNALQIASVRDYNQVI